MTKKLLTHKTLLISVELGSADGAERESVLLGRHDLVLVVALRFGVLLGAFLLEGLACLFGHVLSRRFVGHGAPWFRSHPGSLARRFASPLSMAHEIGGPGVLI